MTIRAGEQVLAQVSMVAKDSVPRLSWGELFAQILKSLCMAKS